MQRHEMRHAEITARRRPEEEAEPACICCGTPNPMSAGMIGKMEGNQRCEHRTQHQAKTRRHAPQ